MVLSQLEMARKLGFRRTNGLATTHYENNICPCTILCTTKATHSLRCWKLHHQMCRSEEILLALDYILKSLLQCLALVHLMQGYNEFRWNLDKSRKFLVDSMYKALIQPEMLVDNNKKIWKMKFPLKTRIFTWYLCSRCIFLWVPFRSVFFFFFVEGSPSWMALLIIKQ
jgi:hypothetical protein